MIEQPIWIMILFFCWWIKENTKGSRPFFSFAFVFAVTAENFMKLLSTRLLDVNAFELKLTPIICAHFWYTYTKCQELLQKPCRRRKQCTMTGVYAVRISIQTNVCYLYFLSLVTSHFVVIVMPNTVSIANSIWKSCMDSIHTHTQTKVWFMLRYSFVWHIAMRFSVSIQMTRWKDVTFRMGIFNPFQRNSWLSLLLVRRCLWIHRTKRWYEGFFSIEHYRISETSVCGLLSIIMSAQIYTETYCSPIVCRCRCKMFT